MKENIDKSLFHGQSTIGIQGSPDNLECEKLKLALQETRICTFTEVPAEQNAFEIDGIGFFAIRDIHSIKGKQKGGKSSVLKVLIAALLKGQMFRIKSQLVNPRITYFDTEQSCTDTKRILQDIAQMTGLGSEVIDKQVALYSLRRKDREQLMPMLRVAIQTSKPDVVFLDGLVDFVNSFNDEMESKRIVHELLVLCDEYNCAIICVLHTNKADDDHNMRGHLGTMQAQKSGTVLECKKVKGVITVSCTDSRHAEMPQWSIMYDEEGHIVDADERYKQLLEQRKAEQDKNRKEAAEKEKQKRIEKCLVILRDNGGAISRKQLTEQLASEFQRDRTTVASYISEWLKDKAIFEDSNGLIQASEEYALAF